MLTLAYWMKIRLDDLGALNHFDWYFLNKDEQPCHGIFLYFLFHYLSDTNSQLYWILLRFHRSNLFFGQNFLVLYHIYYQLKGMAMMLYCRNFFLWFLHLFQDVANNQTSQNQHHFRLSIIIIMPNFLNSFILLGLISYYCRQSEL